MSLFLRRLYPSPDEFQLAGSIGAELASGVDVMAMGVTICLPGESEELADLKSAGSPFVARFKQPPGLAEASGFDYTELLRQIMTKLFDGYQIEVRPGFYWSLLRNPALAAELCVAPEDDTDAVLLMEKKADRDKTMPDAVYRLSRLAEHEFLRDLLEEDDNHSDGDSAPDFGESGF